MTDKSIYYVITQFNTKKNIFTLILSILLTRDDKIF